MAGGGGEGVVVVVPALTQAENTTEDVVGGMIGRFVRATPEHMADRIDRPSNVMGDKDTHQPTPNQTEQGTHPGHGYETANGSGKDQTDEHPNVNSAGRPSPIRGHQAGRAHSVSAGALSSNS